MLLCTYAEGWKVLFINRGIEIKLKREALAICQFDRCLLWMAKQYLRVEERK